MDPVLQRAEAYIKAHPSPYGEDKYLLQTIDTMKKWSKAPLTQSKARILAQVYKDVKEGVQGGTLGKIYSAVHKAQSRFDTAKLAAEEAEVAARKPEVKNSPSSRDLFMKPRPIIGGSNDINSSRTPVKPNNNAKRIEHTYTRKEALAEACDAGRQYRKDVDTGFMRPSQAEFEASSYARHLASKSKGVDRYELYEKIKQGLWHDRCF